MGALWTDISQLQNYKEQKDQRANLVIIIQFYLINGHNMLSERKKYNYLTNVPTGGISRRRQPSLLKSRAQKQNIVIVEPTDLFKASQNRKMCQLKQANKKMLEQTTKQFQKFQSDVMRVQGILKLKQNDLLRLESENKGLLEDKAALIEAMKHKELIIQEFHSKLRELIRQKQKQKQLTKESESSQTYLTPHLAFNSTQTQEQGQSQKFVSEDEYTELQRQLEIKTISCGRTIQRVEFLEEQSRGLQKQLYQKINELNSIRTQFMQFKTQNNIDEIQN